MSYRQHSYLLRLLVPDAPGSLGAVATALGAAGIDILSVEVLERAGGVAVDDLVVALPQGRLPDTLITATQAVPGVLVESLRPFSGLLDTHRELALLEALADAEGGAAGGLLAGELPRVFHSGWAALLQCSGGVAQVVVASAAAPRFDGLVLPWMPLARPRLLPSEEEWLPEKWREMAIEMMAVPFTVSDSASGSIGPTDAGGAVEAGGAVVLGRSGGPVFRRSELLRLAHLTGIAGTVGALPLRYPSSG